MEKVNIYKTVARVSFIFAVLIGVYLFFDYFLSTSQSFISAYPYLIPLILFGFCLVLFFVSSALAKNCKSVAEELNETQNRFSALLDTVTTGFVVTDLEGNIQDSNRKAKEILGLNDSETINLFQISPSLWDIVKDVVPNPNEIETNKAKHFGIIELVSFDREKVSLDLSISTFHRNNNTFFLFSFYELTDFAEKFQTLAISEKKFKTLVNSMSDAVVLVDREAKIVDYNKAFKNLFKIEDYDSKNFFEVIFKDLDLPEERKDELQKRMYYIFATGDFSKLKQPIYGKLKFFDGRIVYFTKSVFKVEIDEGLFYVGAILKDITELQKLIEQLKELNENLDELVRKRTNELENALKDLEKINSELEKEIEERKKLEIAIQKSKETYQNFLESLPVPVYRTNSKGDFLFANNELVRLLGCKSKEELFQTSAFDYYPNPEQRKNVLAEHKKSQKEYIKAEFELIRKDGKHLFVQDFGRAFYDAETNQQTFEGVIIDVTDEVTYKRNLEQSEKRYRNLFEGITEIVLQINLDGQILIVSPSVSVALGYSPEELVGVDFKKLLSKAEFFDRLVNPIKEKGKILNVLLELTSKYGVPKFLSGDFLLSENETINAILRDVTEEYENKNFMSALFSIFRIFYEEKNIYLIGESIEKALRYLISVPNYLFALKDENEERLNVLVHFDRYGTRFKYIDLNDNSNPFTKAFRSQKVEIFEGEDLKNLFGNPKYPDPAKLLVLPLGTYTTQIGIIAIYSHHQPEALSKTNIYYLNTIAEQISIGLERKLLADKLNLQIKLFETLVESIPYPIYYRDLNSGKYLYCNESFARFAEKPKEEIIGRTIEESLSPEIVKILKEKDEEILTTGKIQTFELKKTFPNGVEQTYVNIRSPIQFDALRETAVVGILIDITDRINYERELQNALNFNKLILETAPVGIATIDKNSKVTFCNQKAEALTGYSANDFDGEVCPLCVGSTNLDEMLALVWEQSGPIEQRLTRKDGKEIIIRKQIAPLHDDKGEIYGAIISFDDITSQKESEKKLQFLAEVNSRLASVANLVVTISEQTTLFEVVFPIALQISGAEEMVFVDIDSKTNIPTIKQIELVNLESQTILEVNIPLEKFVNSYFGKVYTEREPLIIEKAQTERLINGLENLSNKNLALFPLYATEKVIGILTLTHSEKTFSDEVVSALNQLTMMLTTNIERIYFQNELTNTLQKQVEINELRSNFISMISHEYRTPLQAVLLSAEILQKHYDRLTSEQRDMQYRRIARAVEDMATMLDNVILYNRLSRASERVNFETVKVKPYFEGVIRDFELYYHDKAKIVSKTKFKVQEAKVEQRLLQLILSNLISNAIKYSRSEPVVEIEVEVRMDSIKLVIADNGIGIPEEELPLVFEPFYRGKNTKLIAGTGLGLSIVKNSVDLLGGQISVESKLNEGTKFTIEIPIP